jgi:hypothetical protein
VARRARLSTAEQKLKLIYQRMATAELRQRVAGGELAPLAHSIAERELRSRPAQAEEPPAGTHEQMLIELYRNMPSDEIRQRLAGDALVPLARGVAENELQLRRRHDDGRGAGVLSLKSRLARDGLRGTDTLGQRGEAAQRAKSRPPRATLRQTRLRNKYREHFSEMPGWVWWRVLVAIVALPLASRLPLELAIPAVLFGPILLARVAGKALSEHGLWIGALLMGSPLYVLVFLAYKTFVNAHPSGAALPVSFILCFIGYQMRRGAAHRGTWADLGGDLDELLAKFVRRRD